jgi:hypothetical protein
MEASSKGGSTQSPAAPIDVFHRCLAVLALEKDERDKDSVTSANSLSADTLTRKADSYNARMTTLITELMSSYDTAAVSERHRVFPFVLSSVSKILSRKFPTASPVQSSDVSNSSGLILAVISCFHSSLRGLTTVNLCPSLSNAAATGDSEEKNIVDESMNENENDVKTNAPEKNQNNQNIGQNAEVESEEEENISANFPSNSHIQNSDVAEGIVLYLANQMVVSKIIFLLTICLESLKASEIQNSKTNTAGSRSIVSIRSGNSNSSSSSSKRSTEDNQTSDNSKNCDDIYPLKKHLNADDDAIIVQIFSSLRIAQVFDVLSDDREINQMKRKDEKKEEKKEVKAKESAFLKPFSGVFLAQFVQFSLFFSVHRYTDSSM